MSANISDTTVEKMRSFLRMIIFPGGIQERTMIPANINTGNRNQNVFVKKHASQIHSYADWEFYQNELEFE